MTHDARLTSARSAAGSAWEVFLVFLRLGLTSFGGPIAHLGYFREELVERRRWLSDAAYADLVALCQFLPGPASSQVGFALGVMRGGGIAGGLAAWLGFTLPSALVLFAFAIGAASISGPIAQGVVHGLKLVAVAVVAQAVWGMARSLAPDRERAAIVLLAVLIVVLFAGTTAQVAAIVAGAIVGLWLCRDRAVASVTNPDFPVSSTQGALALLLFALLLIVLPLLSALLDNGNLNLIDSLYRAGALVFGGGHVVLPLLQQEMVAPGWVGIESFLAGYGVAQAVPGPLFTFAVWLGADASVASSPAAGAALALIAVFVPGLLLVYGMLPFWGRLRSRPAAQAAMRGANAAVVGILAAALYTPVWTGAVLDATDFALALVGFLLLTVWKAPPWTVVLLLAAVGGLQGRLG